MQKGFISNYLKKYEIPHNSDQVEFISTNDESFMSLAIDEARKSDGAVHPNPYVGAVIVKNGKILGIGRHEKCGELHAERNALKDAFEKGNDVKGATIYVTLEPCCHTGKQPPCTEALIEAGIKKVVIGSSDPNELVNGKGVSVLREAGIEVVQGVLKEKCDQLNKIFFSYIKNKIPFVVLKYAMTADGKIATSAGESKWISGEKSRGFVHLLRGEVSAVLTGIGTVKKDNPQLTCRLDDGKKHFQPTRIVCDSNLQIDIECNLVKTAGEVAVIIVCTDSAYSRKDNCEKIEVLKKAGCIILPCREDLEGHVDLAEMLKNLGQMKVDSILVEGGASINSGFLFYGNERKCLANEIVTFVSPKIFGGKSNAFSPVAGSGVESVSEGEFLSLKDVCVMDNDIMIDYEVNKEAMYVYGNN